MAEDIEFNDQDFANSSPSFTMIGINGKPLRTEKDYYEHQLYIQSKNAMHEAIKDVGEAMLKSMEEAGF